MRIFVLALDQVFDSGLSTVLDAFQTANDLAGLAGMTYPRFDIQLVGMRKKVTTGQGFSVPVQLASKRKMPDCVVVPAIAIKTPEPLGAALAKPEIQDAAGWIAFWANRGAGLAAACVGTFVLAESGVLNRERATTTWWLASYFRQRYPGVTLDESQMIVKSRKRPYRRSRSRTSRSRALVGWAEKSETCISCGKIPDFRYKTFAVCVHSIEPHNSHRSDR